MSRDVVTRKFLLNLGLMAADVIGEPDVCVCVHARVNTCVCLPVNVCVVAVLLEKGGK